jgi:hypothetical protein
MTDRKKPGVAFWATVVVVVVLVAYPLSFGPACWLFATSRPTRITLVSAAPDPRYAPRAYWPIGWLAKNGPGRVGDVIFWYAKCGSPNAILLPTTASGGEWYDSRIHELQRLFDQ